MHLQYLQELQRVGPPLFRVGIFWSLEDGIKNQHPAFSQRPKGLKLGDAFLTQDGPCRVVAGEVGPIGNQRSHLRIRVSDARWP